MTEEKIPKMLDNTGKLWYNIDTIKKGEIKMKIKFEKSRFEINKETMKDLYKIGYRFYCDGDYTTTNTIDPWSGMPDVTRNTYFFDTKEEAEAFAITQRWIFNPDIHATVYAIKG